MASLLLTPPGLPRPSSWPVRNQRRHAATASFNAKVLESLLDISLKLDGISNKLDNFKEGNESCTDELEKRVKGMELLLFRTHLDDFKTIDASIMGTPSLRFRTQPDPELSPLADQNSASTAPDDAARFDIFEERIDAACQWEWQPCAGGDEAVIQFPSPAIDASIQFAGVGCEDSWATLLSADDLNLVGEMRDMTGDWETFREPEVGWKIRTVKGFVTADAPIRLWLPKGICGVVRNVDDEGYMQVFFPAILEDQYASFPKWFGIRWISSEDVINLQRLCEA